MAHQSTSDSIPHVWYHDADDEHPIPSSPVPFSSSSHSASVDSVTHPRVLSIRGHPQHMSGSPSRSSARIVANQRQSDTKKRRPPSKPKGPPPKKSKTKAKPASTDARKSSKATRTQVVVVDDSGEEDAADQSEEEDDPDIRMAKLESLSSQDTGTVRSILPLKFIHTNLHLSFIAAA